MFDLKTLSDVFVRATRRGDHAVMMSQDDVAVWSPIPSTVLYGRVRALVEAFQAWGLQPGDRIALIAENRWEWQVTDFASLVMGCVDVPLYLTLTAEQFSYMLRDSGARVAVVSSAEVYEKIAAAGELPALEHVVVMDAGEFAGAESFGRLMERAPELEQRSAEFDAMVASRRPEELATIIYTSGTTGEPKGVMLTHGNIASNLNYSTGPIEIGEQDVSISFLPLSHVTARHLDYALLCHGTCLAYCAKFEQLPEAMKVVRPMILVAVPRVYEKIRQAVETKASASPVKRRILHWAFGVGRKYQAVILSGIRPSALRWRIADKLAFRKIIEAFGGRARLFLAGGAPLGIETGRWFADVGIAVYEGYGLTETSPVIALNYPGANKLGSVGRPLANLQCRFAEDGELEVKGPSVFTGYWHKETESKEAFTDDGWFRTGDIGVIDEDGFLSITDRKKEMIKTSGGKLIAPQAIENLLKVDVLVGQAALVGDKHKFASVLISPNLVALRDWARRRGIVSDDTKTLIQDPKVLKAYQEIVDRVNGSLAHYETIKRLCVVPEEWSVEDGILTPSMKIKRRVINERYAPQIAAFYADEQTSRA